MAACAFEGAAVGSSADVAAGAAVAASAHGHGHGLSGVLSVFVIVGAGAVVLWTVAAEWFIEPVHRGRTARLLTTESWAMAGGVAVMCLGF